MNKSELYIKSKLKNFIEEIEKKPEFTKRDDFIIEDDDDMTELLTLAKKHIASCKTMQDPSYKFLSNNLVRGCVLLSVYYKQTKSPLTEGRTARVIQNTLEIKSTWEKQREKENNLEIKNILLPIRIWFIIKLSRKEKKYFVRNCTEAKKLLKMNGSGEYELSDKLDYYKENIKDFDTKIFKLIRFIDIVNTTIRSLNQSKNSKKGEKFPFDVTY